MSKTAEALYVINTPLTSDVLERMPLQTLIKLKDHYEQSKQTRLEETKEQTLERHDDAIALLNQTIGIVKGRKASDGRTYGIETLKVVVDELIKIIKRGDEILEDGKVSFLELLSLPGLGSSAATIYTEWEDALKELLDLDEQEAQSLRFRVYQNYPVLEGEDELWDAIMETAFGLRSAIEGAKGIIKHS